MNELLLKILKERLPKLGDQEAAADPVVHASFFSRDGGWNWFVTEGQTEGDDLLFFGYVIGLESEWGYFMLSELEEINAGGPFILCDPGFEPRALSSCLAALGISGSQK